MAASCGCSWLKAKDISGLRTGDGSEASRGPGQCGKGGREQVRAELPDGWSGMTISEYSHGDQYSSESGEGWFGLMEACSSLISV